MADISGDRGRFSFADRRTVPVKSGLAGLEIRRAFGTLHGFPQAGRPENGSAADSHCGPLAQMVEQLAFNQLVIGSIPIRPTTSFLLPYMPLNSRAIAEVRT